MTDTWFTSHTTLVEFAQWMVTDEIHLLSAQDVVDFFEKPWKHEDMWVRYCAATGRIEAGKTVENPADEPLSIHPSLQGP